MITFKLYRIDNLQAIGMALLTALLTFTGCNTGRSTEKIRYNVLFLSVDDMNDYGFSEVYPGVRTPFLDEFATTSVFFRQAYCPSPVCTPSRAAIYSGIYPHRTGAYFNGSDPWRKSELLMDCETMPECFKRNGYITWGRGKLYHAQLEEGRIEKNFDNRPIYGGGFGPFPESSHHIKGRFWGIQAFPDSVFPDVMNADAAIAFLQQEHETPFYLSLGLWRPHTPFTCPQRFYDMYDLEDIILPPGYLAGDTADLPAEAKALLDPFGRFNPSDEQEWKELIRAYLACTSFADWNIGRVIRALDSSGYAENTIVVFWSDNGYHCGEKNHWEKNTLWEQASRVPMAIRIPGNRQNGRECLEPVNLVDLYPTLADYCNLEVRVEQLDGESLHPQLENPGRKYGLTALTTFGKGFAGIRNSLYRYIIYGDGTEELYDHRTDPYEWNNLAGNPDYRRVKLRLRKQVPAEFAEELEGRRN